MLTRSSLQFAVWLASAIVAVGAAADWRPAHAQPADSVATIADASHTAN